MLQKPKINNTDFRNRQKQQIVTLEIIIRLSFAYPWSLTVWTMQLISLLWSKRKMYGNQPQLENHLVA